MFLELLFKVGANQSENCLFSKIEAIKCVSRTVIQSRGEQVGIPTGSPPLPKIFFFETFISKDNYLNQINYEKD